TPPAPAQGGGPSVEQVPEPAAPTSGARLPDEIELTRLTPDRPVELLPEAWLRLEFDTGEVVDVVGDGAIGRDPAHSSGRSAHHQVALQDPDRALSRLHLLFGPEQGGALLWVSDPGSTNGTVLQDPTGAVAVLAPGVRAVIGAGWQLKLGDRTVRVSAIV
ncbi:MAG: FHA domain-containing protein, partial [Cellulomonas sp.]|nr:FHA domain-containing protein [Cellulomonas sp.]